MIVNTTFNGLWTVEFISTLNRSGKGVMVLINGHILGGDEGYYYSGTYQINGQKIHGNVNIIRFDANTISVFGDINQFLLTFLGDINDHHLTVAGSVANNSQYQIRIIGHKKEDI